MNPYKRWLGISSGTTNPDYFELLGVDPDEYDRDVIKAAARLQLAKLQKHQAGRYADACEKIAKRINRAYAVLTNPRKRKKYLVRLAAKNGQPNPDVGKIDESRFANARPKKRKGTRSVSAIDKWKNQQKVNSSSSRLKGIAVFFVAALLLLCVGLTANFVIKSTQNKEVVSLNSDSVKVAVSKGSVEKKELAAEVETDVSAIDSGMDNSTELDVVGPVASTLTDQEKTKTRESSRQELTKESPADRSVEPQAEEIQTTVSVSEHEAATLNLNGLTEESRFASAKPSDNLSSKAHTILANHCASCHGGGDAEEGGFDFVLNRQAMVAAGYVTPREPGSSLLLERMSSSETPMPPKGESSRPTAEEISTIERWIRRGAHDFGESTERVFVSTSQLYKTISADLKKVEKADRKYIRYFSVQHLANAGYSDAEIEVSRLALQKLLNSLSWHRKLIELDSVSGSASIFRIDLRSLKWRPIEWKLVESRYEYAVLYESTAALELLTETECEVPVIRGDWFVAQASRPPLYHDLLQLPESDSKLEQILKVDIERNLDEMKTVRAGFTRSGVSQNNRLIERHDSLFGAYWKSYDFGGNTGRKNLFEFPLGPGSTSNDFEHDGGEIIFTLPNGMLAFMLVDQSGQRIDKGPTAIVSDPRQPDRAVVNGVSCMSCHYGGFIPKDDEIRGHVLANKGAYTRSKDILALYPESNRFRKFLQMDSHLYLNALAKIGIENPSRSKEPVVMIANRYGNEVNATIAAAELGIQKEELIEKIKNLRDLDLVRQVGPLSVAGGMLKRETFSGIFLKLVIEMGLGRKAFIAPRELVKTDVSHRVGKRTPLFSNGPNEKLPFGNDARAAETALQNTVRFVKQRQLDQAVNHFEDAIRLATNLQFRARAYEEAMEVFAAQGKI